MRNIISPPGVDDAVGAGRAGDAGPTAGKPAAPLTGRPRRRLRRLVPVVGYVMVGVIVLATVGAILQTVAERRDIAEHPPPGDHVTLPDGRDLHLQVAGEEHDGPTVVLQSGAGGAVTGWGWIFPALAQHVTVVAYDRAGIGWSDPSENNVDPDQVTADLRTALAARGLPGPYVLVGHSIGGHYVRAFADAHPDEVAGVVLVDPSHEDQTAVTGIDPARMAPMFTAMRAAARLGLMRIYSPYDAELMSLPRPQRDQALAQQRSVAYWRSFATEMTALDQVAEALPRRAGALGNTPLHVLIATGGGDNDDQRRMIDAMADLRADMADLSTNGRVTILPDADHVTIITDPTQAAAVSAAILDLVTDVTSGP